MESFLYPELNHACRSQDKDKIQFYGAFAAALSYIIYFANEHLSSQKHESQTTLFRGLKLPQQEADNCFKINSKVNLTGYTSSSRNAGVALRFALLQSIENFDTHLLSHSGLACGAMFGTFANKLCFPRLNQHPSDWIPNETQARNW